MVKRNFTLRARKGLVEPAELKLRREGLLKHPDAQKKKQLINDLLVSDSRAVFQRACIRASGLHLSKGKTIIELGRAIKTLYLNGAQRAMLRGDEKVAKKFQEAAEDRNVEKVIKRFLVTKRVFKSRPLKGKRRTEKWYAGASALTFGTALLNIMTIGELSRVEGPSVIKDLLTGGAVGVTILGTGAGIWHATKLVKKREIDKYKRGELKKKVDEYKKLKEQLGLR